MRNRSFSLISSFLLSNVSELLISLTKNERPWAIRSGRSEEMSDVSESLISLIFGQKSSDVLGNQMSKFPALQEWHEKRSYGVKN